MKRFVLIFFIVLAVSCVAGCWGGGLDEEFVKAVDKNWDVIGPDYARYLEADGTLSERSKRIRLRAVAEFSLLVADAKAEFEKEGGAP